MGEIDSFRLDRDVARAAAALVSAKRRARVDPTSADTVSVLEDPRIAHVASPALLAELRDANPRDPLRAPLARWVRALAFERAAARFDHETTLARRVACLTIARPERCELAPSAVVGRVLAERDRGRRDAWLAALAEAPELGRLRDAERRLAERRVELDDRLGGDEPSSLGGVDVAALARATLAATRDVAASAFGGATSLGDVIGAAVASDAPGDYPAKITTRWLASCFAGTDLVAGLAPELGPLPRSLGASSHARALARFGAAWSRAAARRGLPFVLAREPEDARAFRRGALFGALAAHAPFVARTLGASRSLARDAARTVARGFSLALRLEAARALVALGRAGERERVELCGDALLAPFPAALDVVVPRPRRDAPARLVAALAAPLDHDALVERFDEDWFRNPRAAEHLLSLIHI